MIASTPQLLNSQRPTNAQLPGRKTFKERRGTSKRRSEGGNFPFALASFPACLESSPSFVGPSLRPLGSSPCFLGRFGRWALGVHWELWSCGVAELRSCGVDARSS